MKISIFLLVFLLGCSTRGFNRKDLHARLGQETQVTDADIAEALKKRPQLPTPFKLGVHFDRVEKLWINEDVRWTLEDKKKMLSLVEAYKDKLHIESVTELVVEFGNGNTPHELRLAGAKQGVDAVLSVRSIAQLTQESNVVAWSYIAIVPMFFAPGTDYKGHFVTQAFLYDVKNGFTYFGAEGDGETVLKKPLLERYRGQAVDGAKSRAIDQLILSIKAQLESLSASAK